MGGLPRNCSFSHRCQFHHGTWHAIGALQLASTVQSRTHNTGKKLCKNLSLCALPALLFWSPVCRLAMTAMAAPASRPTRSAQRVALAGAVVAKAIDGDVATGALIGAAGGALCDDAGVCQRRY